MTKVEKLSVLNTKWAKENTCKLKKTATQPVFGEGSPTADIVFIGEAPGKMEDKTGKPFVGASGKFLAEMLDSIKLKREDVYITNIVKYRPPDNRDPLPEEKESCRQWLEAELNLIKPKLVVFLGRHAMRNFFPDYVIGDVHGTLIHKKIPRVYTEYFLPLYHPASALYNGGMRETLKEDFVLISKIIQRITVS